MSYQKYIAMGNITRQPELRSTTGGHSICEFGIAVDSGWGENKKTTFWDVSVWGKQGESLKEYFNKGDGIVLEGEIILDQWEDKNGGGKRSKHKFQAKKWTFPANGPDAGNKGKTDSSWSSPEKKSDTGKEKAPSSWNSDQEIDEIPF